MSATCESATAQNIIAKFSVSPLRSEQQILVNRQQLSLGTLLQLLPPTSPAQLGTESVVLVLTLPPSSHTPDVVESLGAQIASHHFKFQSKAEIEDLLPADVILYLADARRRMLRDPVAIINDDNQAIRALRDGPPRSRFAIVSAIWLDDYVDMWISPIPFAALNTIEYGRLYLHPQYVCPPLTAVRSDDGFTDGPERRMLFAYTAVKYDHESKRVVVDGEPLDLSRFALADGQGGAPLDSEPL